MRIRLNTACFGPNGGGHAGEVVDLPAPVARDLAASGYGDVLDYDDDQAQPETTVESRASQTAALDGRRRRAR